MFFYNFNEIDNFINDDLVNNLMQEKQNIQNIINLYEHKKIYFEDFITNIIDITNSIQKNKLDNFHNTISLLRSCLKKINDIKDLSSNLHENIDFTIKLYNKSLEDNENEIKANLVEYNKKRDELSNKIIEFENFSISCLNSSIELFFKKSNKKFEYIKNSKYTNEDIKEDNNILTISEKEQKAYLPFFYSDIKDIYENSDKYRTMQEVIDKLYIIPLDNFKNSSISRFRESFNLIKYKEKGSLLKALDLALELMFKYELNPIVIAACRSLKELDIYLDCLESNELDDFKCFDIKFEIMPKVLKN